MIKNNKSTNVQLGCDFSDNIKKEYDRLQINGFFGFAVKKGVDKYRRKLIKADLIENEIDIDESNVVITYLWIYTYCINMLC